MCAATVKKKNNSYIIPAFPSSLSPFVGGQIQTVKQKSKDMKWWGVELRGRDVEAV